jgi:hypothetical protein
MKSYNIPDFSKYTLKELYDAYYVVNRRRYPENFRAIINEFKRRNEALPEGDIEIVEEPVKVISEPEEMPVITPKPLPLLTILGDTLSIVWTKKFILLRSLVLPYSLFVVIGIIQPYIAIKFGIVMGTFTRLLGSIAASLYVVTCHRLIILGDDSIPRYGILLPKGREIRFWGWTIGIGLLFFIGSLLAMFILHKITYLLVLLFPMMAIKKTIPIELILIILPGIYILASLTLIFPAVAVDQRPSFAWAWKQSSNNKLRFSLIIVIPSAIVFGLNYFTKDTNSLLLSGGTIILKFITAIMAIILISLSYKKLCLEESAMDN